MAESFVGQGDCFIDFLNDNGSENGYSVTGNATTLEITPDSEIKEQFGRGRDNYGQVIASVNIPKPHKFKIMLDQLDQRTMAINFLGEDSVINTASGSITDEAIAVKHDKYVMLSKRGLSSVVVKSSDGVTTYTASTDYVVIARTGLLMALSTGTIADGATVKVSASYAAETGWKVIGATKPSVRMRIFMDGRNLVNGKNVYVKVWHVQVKPTQPVDFLSPDFKGVELEGTMITPTGYASPYQVEQID